MKMTKKLMALVLVGFFALPMTDSLAMDPKVQIQHVRDAINTLMDVRKDLLLELGHTTDLEKQVELGSHIHEIDLAITVLHTAEHYKAKKEEMKK